MRFTVCPGRFRLLARPRSKTKQKEFSQLKNLARNGLLVVIALIIALLPGSLYRPAPLLAEANPTPPRVSASVSAEIAPGASLTPASATFVISTNGGLPLEAYAALQTATAIWAGQISSAIPIIITPLYNGLASNFPFTATPSVWQTLNSPFSNTMYPIAYASMKAGRDLDTTKGDIDITFNSNLNWYFGTDGQPRPDQYDFLTYALQAIGQGLGFKSSLAVDTASNTGYISSGTSKPFYFDQFVYNGSNQKLLNSALFGNGTPELRDQIISGNLYFSSSAGYATSANCGVKPKLYAPNPYDPYTSIAYLDAATFQNVPDALMLPPLPGITRHDPGFVARGMLKDMGWTVTDPPLPLPANLTATALSTGEIKLTWQASAGAQTGYKIQRKEGSAGQWADLAQTGANVFSYTDSDLKPGTLYTYQVRSFNCLTASAYSSPASAKTFATPGQMITIIPNTPPLAGNLSQDGDAGWYIFNVAAEADYTVTVMPGTLSSLRLTLYGPDGYTVIGSAANSGSGNAQVFKSLSPGAYYVAVTAPAGFAGSYNIAVSTPITLSAIAPASVMAGGPNFTLTLKGSGFVPDLAVYIDGAVQAPADITYVNSTTMLLKVASAEIVSAGTRVVTVGGPSNPGQTLTVSDSCIATVVNSTATDGSCGTLPYALQNAADGTTIDFALPLNSTISYGDWPAWFGAIPDTAQNITLQSACSLDGPSVNFRDEAGQGFYFTRGLNFNGIYFQGKAPDGKMLSLTGKGSKFSCTRVKRVP
ncbi:MAG TPA: fibronectin type III domain-containing protein [Chloroflexia bacterium]|nr:fibronectin type III domain-containing protein [Chloroflexia bacterium]